MIQLLKIFIAALLVTVISVSAAQELDRLYYNYQTEFDDTSRVQELIDLANECRYYFPESQEGFVREALQISKETNYSLGEALALKALGNYFFELGNYDSSYKYYTQSKSILSSLGNKKELSNVFGDYCYLCINKGEYNKALEAGLTALQIAGQSKDIEQLQLTYSYLGYTYFSIKNMEEAAYYLNLGLDIANTRNDLKGKARILSYLALVFEFQDNLERAAEYFSEAAHLLQNEVDKHSLGIAFFNLGESFRCQNENKKALQNYILSYSYLSRLNDQDTKTIILMRIAKVYIKMLQSGNLENETAILLQETGFANVDKLLSATCKKLKNSNNKDNMLECLQLLIELKKVKKEYREVYQLNMRLAELKDTIMELNKANVLADLLVRQEMENDNKQIYLLNLINQTNADKISNQKAQQIIIGLIAVMLLSLLIALRSRIKTIARTKNELALINSKLEAEKLKAEQSEHFKEQFLANVSHEIRTPLNAIIGINNILLKNKQLKSQEVYLEAMRISSKKLLGLINDILSLSKLEAGKVEIDTRPFSLLNILENVISALRERATQKGNELQLDYEQDMPGEIIGDDAMLTHILLTLVRNGNSFTENGKIKLSCKLINRNEEYILALFTVSDTGIGIVPEKHEKLLNTFMKVSGAPALDYDGSGLELTVIRHMVELQGGTIELESEPGKGTTFRVEIPYQISIQETKQTQKSIPENGKNNEMLDNLSLLLVEDNDFNIMVARDVLFGLIKGLKLQIAKNGKIALEKIESQHFDMILMDLQMPVMNGYDATIAIRNLKGSKAEIPIIAMTANNMESETQKCLECGMNSFISKPFDTKILEDKIRSLLKPDFSPNR